MRLHRNLGTLLIATTPGNDDKTGSTYRIESPNDDAIHDGEQGFQVYFSLSQTGGATSPTTRAKLQTSLDKQSWIDVVLSTQLTADGSKVETLDAGSPSAPLLTYVRAVTVLAGGTKPNHTVDVRLLSTAPFRLRKE